ncbi:MAG TPA: carbohydrate porin, partial [Polyangiaceae bacterium]
MNRSLPLAACAAVCTAALLFAPGARADEPPAPPPPAAMPLAAPTQQPPAPTQPAAAPAQPAQPPELAPSTPIAAPPTAAIPLPTVPGDTGRFEFGSYGRVQVASDGRGGTGRSANIVAHGDRIDEDSYAELELRREDQFAPNVTSRVVATLALFPPFFHFSGDATQAIAVRNLYAQGTYGDWTLWVGSRMYRGDDIYLLDYWPLDNENTVGFGVSYHTQIARGERRDGFEVALHGGENRLDNMFQYQTVDVPNPAQGDETIVELNRQRLSASLGISYLYDGGPGNLSAKAKLFTQLQHIGPGTE